MNTEKHQRSVTARFSAASRTYHERAEVQKIVAERLLRLASDVRPIERILEIGCGTGGLTELFLEHFPGVTIDAMDASKDMIDRAKERLAGNDRVRWHISDLKRFAPNVLYPLIVSSSSMHWILPVEDGFRRMANLLEVGGDVVVALMLHGTLSELHAMRLGVAPHKPPLGRLPLAEEVLSGMERAGLRVLAKQQETIRKDYVSADAFLRTIHE